MIELGKRYRDVISGAEGIANEKITYLNNCIRYQLVAGIDENNKIIKYYIYEQQLEAVEDK